MYSASKLLYGGKINFHFANLVLLPGFMDKSLFRNQLYERKNLRYALGFTYLQWIQLNLQLGNLKCHWNTLVNHHVYAIAIIYNSILEQFHSVLIDSPSKYIIHSIFSDSVSPAFLIRVGASINYSGSGEDESDSKENIYEEIKDKPDDNLDKSSSKDSRKSSSMSQDAETQSQTKSKFQKALEAVTRRSSRSLDVGSEKSFHLSISKGRKKSLIDKAKVDWDCYGPEMDRGLDACLHSKLNKSSSDMLGEVNSSHDRVMSQLKLDVEVSLLL